MTEIIPSCGFYIQPARPTDTVQVGDKKIPSYTENVSTTNSLSYLLWHSFDSWYSSQTTNSPSLTHTIKGLTINSHDIIAFVF